MDSRSFALYQHLRADLFRYVGGDCQEYLNNTSRINMWPGISTKQFACIQLLNNIFKKFEGAKATDADCRAETLFLEFNDRCKSYSDIDFTGASELESIAIDLALNELRLFFEDDDGFSLLNAPRILSNLGVGPGASVGTSGNSHFHKFFGGPITCTSAGLARLIQTELTTNNSLLAEALNVRQQFFGDCKEVAGNVLSFAFKNTEISRVICTEPSENMKFQKGIQLVLEHQLRRRYGIDFSYQPEKNAKLCEIGSLNQQFDSTDLRSASDCVAYLLLRKYIPSGSFGWLNASRSPRVYAGGQWHTLHMMSSMGNAFTFPLQTALFTFIVIGCYKALDVDIVYPRGGRLNEGGSLGNFGVFGDDIVTDKRVTNLTHQILKRFGFIVNTDKSFSDGDFRESCGSDYKSGHDVRAVYLTSLSSMQDVSSAYNLLSAWSCNQAVQIPRTLHFLRGLYPETPDVPPYEDACSGFWTPLAFARNVSVDENGSVLYYRYVPIARKFKVERRGKDRIIKPKNRSGKGRPKGAKPYCINSAGLIISVSAGYARGGTISIRNPSGVSPKYQKLIAVSPGWDYACTEYDGNFTRRGFARWRRKTSARALALVN